MASLLAELGRPDVRGTEDEPAAREVYERYLLRDDTAAFVAERDGRVVGFVNLDLRTRLNFSTPQAWIPDLVVAEGSRSEGVGAALLERCEEFARERGCWSLTLESANWRERAQTFYERQGLKDSGKAFAKVLADIEWPPAPRP